MTETFRKYYLRLRQLKDHGSVQGADPYPEDLEAERRLVLNAAEQELGRALTEDEVKLLLEDDDGGNDETVSSNERNAGETT